MEKQNQRPKTTKAHVLQSKEMYYNTNKNKKKLQPALVASYNIWPGNGEDLFWFQRFINFSLTYLLRHLPTYLQPGTHTGPVILLINHQLTIHQENTDVQGQIHIQPF